jgi:hypothetical protein
VVHGPAQPWIWLAPLLLAALFVAPVVWLWRRLPRDGAIPPSYGEQLALR